MIRRLLLLGLLLLALPAWGAPPLVVLVSLDGFRWDYLEKYRDETPHLRQMAAEGVRAERLIPCFPTLTFPNHYSIATGLRPAHHGIVANTFHDPALAADFNYRSHESAIDGRWWGGEPVWITAVKQGLRSACMFWPGSEAEIAGARPTYHRTFDGRLTSAQRVDGLLAWIDLPPAQRPTFCTLYLDAVDHAGHDFGPDAPETAAAVRDVDAAVGRLRDGLAARGLAGSADLVVVSDHGMAAVAEGHTVLLDDLVDPADARVENSGALMGLWPVAGTPAALAGRLRRLAPASIHVYQRGELPERLHYRDNPRIAPVVLLADEGWEIKTRAEEAGRKRPERGEHGYDNELPSMGAIFIACGPAFRRGAVIAPVENIQIYDLLCAVLGLKPAPNDGDSRLGDAALQPAAPR